MEASESDLRDQTSKSEVTHQLSQAFGSFASTALLNMGIRAKRPGAIQTSRLITDRQSQQRFKVWNFFFFSRDNFSLQKLYYVQLDLITIITTLRDDYPSHQATTDS